MIEQLHSWTVLSAAQRNKSTLSMPSFLDMKSSCDFAAISWALCVNNRHLSTFALNAGAGAVNLRNPWNLAQGTGWPMGPGQKNSAWGRVWFFVNPNSISSKLGGITMMFAKSS